VRPDIRPQLGEWFADFALAGQKALGGPDFAARTVLFRMFYLGMAPYQHVRPVPGPQRNGLGQVDRIDPPPRRQRAAPAPACSRHANSFENLPKTVKSLGRDLWRDSNGSRHSRTGLFNGEAHSRLLFYFGIETIAFTATSPRVGAENLLVTQGERNYIPFVLFWYDFGCGIAPFHPGFAAQLDPLARLQFNF